MTNKTIMVDYYFDYRCPWTYLSFKRLIQTTTRTASKINWKPVALKMINETLNPDNNENQSCNLSKMSYSRKDLQDWSTYCGLSIMPRNDVPEDISIKALCGAIHAIENEKVKDYSALVFQAHFSNKQDISDDGVLLDIAKAIELNLTDFETSISSKNNLKHLQDNTNELIQRGGFGSPTMFVDNDMYYGNDRMPLVEFSIGRASGKILVLPGQHDT